jgi:hypothetical protein
MEHIKWPTLFLYTKRNLRLFENELKKGQVEQFETQLMRSESPLNAEIVIGTSSFVGTSGISHLRLLCTQKKIW